METAIVWFKHDLRLSDHPALSAACREYEQIIPLFIDDPALPIAAGDASRWYLHYALQRLQQSLRIKKQQLVIRQGNALTILQDIVKQHQVSALYFNQGFEPNFITGENQIIATLTKLGVSVHRYNGTLLHHPHTLLTKAETPYKVFTPFWRQLQQQLNNTSPLAEPQLPTTSNWIKSITLDELALIPDHPWVNSLKANWSLSNDSSLMKLNYFIEQTITDYPRHRDFPAETATSRLSPMLHFGEISPRQIHYQLQQTLRSNGAESFLRQVAWREFAYYLLFHFPESVAQPLDKRFLKFPWQKNYKKMLYAWQQGRTGYPIIDAGMRELWLTGWMHNRVRMIVASFLCKNLLIPWQQGAAWFWQTLVDADLANNTLGWQWVAGCGADAAPYFRIFNPISQSEKFDPKGDYLRRWLPELTALPNKWIHKPWLAPDQLLKDHHINLGNNYPEPIVDLAATRERALAAWQMIK